MRDPLKDRYYLEMCAKQKVNNSNPRESLLKALVMLSTDQELDETWITDAFRPLYYRLDCSDFSVALMLRILYLHQDKLSDQLRMQMKEMIISFDYWYSKTAKFPGRQNMWTENHILCFHTSEYLAGQLYPDDVFTYNGLKGSEVCEQVKPKIMDWIRIKGLVGFSEWDSNNYMIVNLQSLLNVYDFSHDMELKQYARQLMDIIMLGISVNSFRGIYASTHGRTEAKYIKNAAEDPSTIVCKLLWDIGEFPDVIKIMKGPVVLATSTYEPDPILEKIARDENKVLENKEQQSFDVEDGPALGRGYEDEYDLTLYWQNMGYTHKLIVDQNKQVGEANGIIVHDEVYSELQYVKQCLSQGIEPEPCRAKVYLSRVNKITYRTADYMLSCAQDFRKGQRGFQQHIWQATLGANAVVFTTQPGSPVEGQGRPDLWMGNERMPRAVQYKNTLIALHHLHHEVSLPYSHAYFPRNEMDECLEVEGWLIGRKDNGYVALYSQHGYRWSTEADLRDCEVLCERPHNGWVCQMGSKSENGSYKQFIIETLETKVQASEDGLRCEFPNYSMELNWEGPLRINDEAQSITNYKRFDNPYCQSDYRSGIYHIQFEGESRVISF